MSANHYSKEEWQMYAEGRIDDRDRDAFEKHLYECDICMNQYVELLEGLNDSGKSQEVSSSDAWERDMPGKDFTDRVMAALKELGGTALPVPEESGAGVAADGGVDAKGRGKAVVSQVPLFRRPLFHYAVAAVITLILMSTGMFHNISSRVEHLETQSGEQREPISERLMEKTVSMLEAMQAQRGGEKHE
jgi:anti-sigma factor RsiW